MTVLELMERVNSREPKKIIAYIQDALNEMQSIIPETVSRSYIDVEADTRFYNLPTTMIKLLGVYRKFDDEGNYIPINRIQHHDLLEDSSTSSTSTDDDIIVV